MSEQRRHNRSGAAEVDNALVQQTERSLQTLMSKFGEPHQRLLQSLMDQGALPTEKACALFRQSLRQSLREGEREAARLPEYRTSESRKQAIDQIINLVNDRLRVIAFRVIRAVDDFDAQTEYLVLASQRAYSPSLAEFAHLSPDEVGLLSKWLEVIMGEGRGSIDQIVALNKVVELPNRLSRDRAQAVIDRLARSNWIVVDNDMGVLRLHQRAIVELGAYLKTQLDADECPLCKWPVVNADLHGQCTRCECRVHRHCMATLTRAVNGAQLKCPGKRPDGRDCGADWSNDENAAPASPMNLRMEGDTTDESD
uniref:Non-structural maintenance of chromosomes element 1 homolog n=1 Tax=Plectus sambesii TaxID=2011161 RepID=A0A914V318_9BILA